MSQRVGTVETVLFVPLRKQLMVWKKGTKRTVPIVPNELLDRKVLL